jgi:DNA-directed RNA polymerase specialized sigma24 family protein
MMVFIEKLKQDDFHLTASIRTYIMAIGKNLWFKRLRNRSTHTEIDIEEIQSHKFYCEISSAIDDEKTYMERLETYMSRISAHCNHLLQMIYFKMKNIKEVQTHYGYSSTHNAQNQKHKCLEQVRRVSKSCQAAGQ